MFGGEVYLYKFFALDAAIFDGLPEYLAGHSILKGIA